MITDDNITIYKTSKKFISSQYDMFNNTRLDVSSHNTNDIISISSLKLIIRSDFNRTIKTK
jgi:hypothetical protein